MKRKDIIINKKTGKGGVLLMYYVEIVKRVTGEVLEVFGPMSLSRAEFLSAGMKQNKEYSVRITHSDKEEGN